MNKQLFFLVFTFLVIFSQNSHAATPDITLPFVNTTQHLSDFKGKLVYLDFWASWCTPCRKSFPWMNKIQQKYADKGFEVIAVNLDKDKSQVMKFLKKYPAQFKIAYDPAGTSADAFNVKTMPSSFLINRKGHIVLKHNGFRKKDIQKIENIILSNL